MFMSYSLDFNTFIPVSRQMHCPPYTAEVNSECPLELEFEHPDY